jgi:Leucine-rich repeat (LRR) protein
MEGIQQYQRAVTPTMNNTSLADNNNQIRGKMLSYSGKKANDFYRGTQQSGGGSGGNRVPRNSLKSFQGNSLEISGQSKPVGTNRGGGILSSRPDLGGGIIGDRNRFSNDSNDSNRDLKASSLLQTRQDLEPLSEEIPSDGILFARFRHRPDSLVVYRLHDEKSRNPERLNLDRRSLDVCPYLENEQKLRLLNYQNNNISLISNLENLPNLIFLDLYNNKLRSLEGCLSQIKGLRVLMVGKNYITELTNLLTLKKLDVLDLHSNQLKEIKGLEELTDLRVLNLAGNTISVVNNLSTLSSLTELNLRRNCIEIILELDRLPSLQRIFLSHNLITSEKNILCLFQIRSLIELSLDSNPIAEKDPQEYRQLIIGRIPRSCHLLSLRSCHASC